jgi:hypothetical protein
MDYKRLPRPFETMRGPFSGEVLIYRNLNPKTDVRRGDHVLVDGATYKVLRVAVCTTNISKGTATTSIEVEPFKEEEEGGVLQYC